MEKINVKVKKWGNSFGIVLPKGTIDNQNLKEGTEITITIQPQHKMKVSDLIKLSKKLGLDKKLKHIDTKKLHDQMNKELWSQE